MTHFDERIGSTANVHGRYIIGFYYFDQKCLRAKIVWKWKFYCSKAICLLLLFLNKKKSVSRDFKLKWFNIEIFNRFKEGMRVGLLRGFIHTISCIVSEIDVTPAANFPKKPTSSWPWIGSGWCPILCLPFAPFILCLFLAMRILQISLLEFIFWSFVIRLVEMIMVEAVVTKSRV